jgi:predicted acylesterase/phospholipase RssA/CRP-like cAMP-binding protein
MSTPKHDGTFELSLTEIVPLLTASTLFRGISQTELLAIAGEVEVVRADAGSTIMRQDEPGDCLFVVTAGRLRALRRDTNGENRAVGEIGRGETVGEMAVLTGEPRSATVVAVRDSDLLRLSKTSFDRLAERHSQTALQMARLIARRLQEAIQTRRRAAIPATIAIVGTRGSHGRSEFARRLTKALITFGTAFHADSDKLPGKSAMHQWINTLESEHTFVVYECDAQRTPWSDRCVRQADRILIVGEADGDPAPTDVELESIRHDGARAELVLLHGVDSPRDTARWLASRKVASHHHVRFDNDGDIQRIARILTGRTVGLVLSGGGARGFSQIGIIRAMQERNIPIDAIGGTSIGSVIGGLFALGRTPEQVADLCRRTFVDMKMLVPQSDYTLPLVSIMSGRRSVDGIKFLFGDTHIEDLWLRYFCVSNNLTRAEVVVHERGPMARWVRASCSVPGVTPPMFDNGDLLVDGGVLNNLPADVMRSACDGVVAAIDVCERVDLRTDAPYVEELSGWKLLLKRLIPGQTRHRIPGFVSILSRTAMLASAYNQEVVKRNVDLYVHPPVDRFSGFAWRDIDAIVDIGYRHGGAAIDQWLSENGRIWEK